MNLLHAIQGEKLNKVIEILMTLFAAFSIQCISGISTSSIFSIILVIGIYLICQQDKLSNQRIFKILAFIFSLITVICTREQIKDYYLGFDNDQYENILTWIAAGCILIGIYYLFNVCIRFLLYHYNKLQIMDFAHKDFDKNKWKVYWWSMFGTCMLFWMPYFILNFPGILSSDSIDQMNQVVGQTAYSNHHPFVHTMFIKLIYNVGYNLFDDVNIAVASYILLQMGVLASIISSVLTHLFKLGVKKKVCIIALCYYIIVPFNGMFAVTMWKDVLFSAFVFAFTYIIFLLVEAYRMNKSVVDMGLILVMLFLLAVLVSLFRSNGWYAILISMPVLALVLKKYWKYMIPTCILVIITVLIFKGPIMQNYNVKQSDFVESLSIPIQQVARVIDQNGNITKEQYCELSKILDVHEVREKYNEYISDPVKNIIRKGNQQYLEENKREFLQIWFQIGIQNPWIYIEAYVEQTKGYYYPDIQYWTTLRGIANNDLGIHSSILFDSFVAEIFLTFAIHWNKFLPIVGLLASIGTMIWFIWILVGNCVYKKEYMKIVFFIPIIAIWITLLVATPVYAEFRYIYSLFFAMPLLIIITLFEYQT